MVSDSLVLHFDTKFRFLLCFEAAKKTRNAKPFNAVVEFPLDLLYGDPIGDKNDATHRHWKPGVSILGARGVQGSLFH